jgi:hypothetical protein
MSRFFSDVFRFDFGDDDSGIWWEARVTVDADYDAIKSYTIMGVHVGGQIMKWNQIPSELVESIQNRMDSVETAEFLP